MAVQPSLVGNLNCWFSQAKAQIKLSSGEELNKQLASTLILFDCVYSCLYYMLSDEINMFKLNETVKAVLDERANSIKARILLTIQQSYRE